MTTTHTTREAWLAAAVVKLAELINETTTLTCTPETIQVSCGWPRQDRNGKVIGQCWPTNTGNGVNHLFVTPLKVDPVVVLSTLLHELVHAADDCKHAHRGVFVRACRALGFDGKPTATFAAEGGELEATLKAIAEELGDYPHQGIIPGSRITKKQSTRMIKCSCEDCEYTVRTTAKWLAVGIPNCPNPECYSFGEPLQEEIK